MEPRAQRMVLFGRRMVFGGLEPVLSEEEKTFQGLQEAGAFRLPGVSQCFRNPNFDDLDFGYQFLRTVEGR